MAAPKKNEFWKLRTKHGRDKIFTTPDKFWDACCSYFQAISDNPLYETIIQSGKKFTLPKMRAMTIEGLCIFLDIETRTFNDYTGYKDFIPIITRVKEIIRTQKFEGAAAGFLNQNIIARDLGLKEHSENNNTTLTKIIVQSQQDADKIDNAIKELHKE